jgi:flagellin
MVFVDEIIGMDAFNFKEEEKMIINHNITAMNTYNKLTANNASQAKSIEKLSSGLRINRAGDDAAGLAISEKMRGQIRGLDQANRNAQDSISLIQTAEGGLNETHSILQRMRELAVQAANDTNSTTDRQALQDEMTQLTNEVDRIANTTEFNTKKLLNGDMVGVQDARLGVGDKESTFANASVAIGSFSTDIVSANATDVIRINFVNVPTSGSATMSQTMFSVSTVLGNINATAVTLSTGSIVISAAAGSTGAEADITLSLQSISKMRSGDTITIAITAHLDAQFDSTKQARAQIGANAGQELGIGINKMDSAALGIRTTQGTNAGSALDITSQGQASGAIKLINNAIERVSTERSKLGALQNRLEHTINNVTTSSENLSAAESRIRDVDMAKEMMAQQKNSILSQAATAMLAQANQLPQGVLQLLK